MYNLFHNLLLFTLFVKIFHLSTFTVLVKSVVQGDAESIKVESCVSRVLRRRRFRSRVFPLLSKVPVAKRRIKFRGGTTSRRTTRETFYAFKVHLFIQSTWTPTAVINYTQINLNDNLLITLCTSVSNDFETFLWYFSRYFSQSFPFAQYLLRRHLALAKNHRWFIFFNLCLCCSGRKTISKYFCLLKNLSSSK